MDSVTLSWAVWLPICYIFDKQLVITKTESFFRRSRTQTADVVISIVEIDNVKYEDKTLLIYMKSGDVF